MAIPGIILAAGASQRLGTNKLLVPLSGHAVLYHSVKAALAAPLDPVILVIGYESEKALAAIAELKDSPKLRILLNAHWEQGRASSLRLALRALPPDAPGTLVLLGDMPLMTSHLIARIVEAFLKTQKLCFPMLSPLPSEAERSTGVRGAIGRPVALPRKLFGEFESLCSDESGFKILQKYWDTAVKIELAPDEEPTQWDLDTPEDLERMLKAF